MKIKRRKSKKRDNFEESTRVGLEKRIKRKTGDCIRIKLINKI